MAITGRCYCGKTRLTLARPPSDCVYCHCSDCRRWTGAPVAAFLQAHPEDLKVDPDPGEVEHVHGVERRACGTCGSPLTARFAYLENQVFIPVGILDDPDATAPSFHCHSNAQVAWLHLEDDLSRSEGSGLDVLNKVRDG